MEFINIQTTLQELWKTVSEAYLGLFYNSSYFALMFLYFHKKISRGKKQILGGGGGEPKSRGWKSQGSHSLHETLPTDSSCR